MNWQEYKSQIHDALDLFEFDEKILQVLRDSVKNRQKIFIGGNGGSAAIAQHYVCDLSKGANKDWSENFRRYQAICLSSNMGYMTAISNDEAYHDVFRQQLINLASPGDILVLISSSGNSPNIVKAAEYGRENGLIVIGISGFSGGKLKELAHHSAHLNVRSYEPVEDIHHIFGHFLAAYLRGERSPADDIKDSITLLSDKPEGSTSNTAHANTEEKRSRSGSQTSSLNDF